ncbi:hypothetical protein BLS_007800 [Venturia inaequalis]|uniref:Potassium transporter n=1 Tax=Venturia inaequalis TaxID=5025 RepID=A0A8H3YU31_VENIN|nr:hypothetical protein BLS_007800 [Venturia inaequalis]KAE9969206.1 hypothetical protein EG328_007003 [Venturia inaequalis]
MEDPKDHITIVEAEPQGGYSKSRGLHLRKVLSRSHSEVESGYDDNFDAPRAGDHHKKQIYHGWPLFLLAYQSAGVIYGDIGTSPLYVFSSTFLHGPPNYLDLVGALSLIIWTLILIVCIKYVLIVLNADNEGQGGTFAMYSLLTRYANISTMSDPGKENMIRIERHLTSDLKPATKNLRNMMERNKTLRRLLSFVAIFGVSLIISDGVITPAQSVLGAIQGLEVVKPDISQGTIIGITCAILVFLFAIQPLGVARIGGAFAPIIMIWLFLNAAFGIFNLVKHDHSVLKAFNPYHAGLYFVRNKTEAWRSLGGILLSFTGVEALFADLGAFSKRSVCFSWSEAAYISVDPEAYSNPFFKAAPPGTFWPSLIISILAAIVASQALITSTFQLLFQVVNMSYFPPISMKHTSRTHHTQVYIPMANWLLMIGTIVVTAAFKNTTKLGNAYGVCVILDTIITTTLVSLVALIVWRIKWYFVAPLWLIFATFEGLYLSSALTKVPDGAWFTLVMAFCIAGIFCTWRYGKEAQWLVERKGQLLRLSKLVQSDEMGALHLSDVYGGGELTKTKGLGVFFDKSGGEFVPVVYEEFLRKFEAQPECQVFLHLRALTIPNVPAEDRFDITKTGLPNCYRMVIRYGYDDSPVIPQLGLVVYDEVRKYIIHDGAAQQNPATTTCMDLPVSSSTSSAEKENKTFTQPSTPTTFGSISSPSFQTTATRLAALDNAYKTQVLFIVGKLQLRHNEASKYNIIKRTLLLAFLWMRESTMEKVTSMKVSMDKLVECGFIREI